MGRGTEAGYHTPKKSDKDKDPKLPNLPDDANKDPNAGKAGDPNGGNKPGADPDGGKTLAPSTSKG